MSLTIFAVSSGAMLGALLRWVLTLKLNSISLSMPLGTLAANLFGSYLVGLSIAFFAHSPHLSPDLKLFMITGFCGALTTFSTFSLEVVNLLQQGRLGWAIGVIALHVGGSLIMTIAGLASWRWL
jgi:CrcB protein